MRLYSLSVLYKGDAKAVLLKAAYDVSSFSFFQRSSVQEFMTFTSQLIVERSSKGSRASVKEQEYLCHVYVRNDSLAGVVIADNEYPSRVAFTLLEKVLDEFSRQVDRIDWPVGSPDTIQYAGLDGHLSRYQNPREADPMTKVQAELDETKIILHNTMESLLERGEKLDDLVSKSEVLGIQSKAFYKTVSPEAKLVLCDHVTAAGRGPCAGTPPLLTSELQPPGSRPAVARPEAGAGQPLRATVGVGGANGGSGQCVHVGRTQPLGFTSSETLFVLLLRLTFCSACNQMPRLEEETCSVTVDRTELARSGSRLIISHLDPLEPLRAPVVIACTVLFASQQPLLFCF
ncbi:hypothetical protein J1605_013388 [Eschrichtius robustus]|uniref:Synaptobrevin homolog YKT6 n=1 Tax=Eschrichtius robustus TaxID=9764 RepID=A0AB34GGE6_ESCRO|nr:hypothetical protein J1605_013388 [Eschrichtius robustus]